MAPVPSKTTRQPLNNFNLKFYFINFFFFFFQTNTIATIFLPSYMEIELIFSSVFFFLHMPCVAENQTTLSGSLI